MSAGAQTGTRHTKLGQREPQRLRWSKIGNAKGDPRMRSLLLRHLVLVALGASAAAAHADNGLLYLGAGISRDSLRNITANHDLDSTSWKAMAGFRPISLFAVEADYIDLGTQ